MKIGFIIGGINSAGGAERVICVLCNAMKRRGHDVVLITQEYDKSTAYYLDPDVRREFTEVKCQVPGFRNMIRNKKLHEILKFSNLDVAVSFMTGMNLQAIIASRNTKVPLIISERVDPNVYRNTVIGFLRALLYPFAKGYVFQTDSARAYFPRRIKEKAVIIPNPILSELIEKKSYRATKRFVAVGRLTQQKNYPFMIRNFAQYVQEFPEYCLEIYGDGELKKSLYFLVTELGLENKVRFMGTCQELHKKIVDADIFLMTSDYEGMSNALAEAMAIGLPCIVTNCSGGGAAYLIQNNQNGILIDCNDNYHFLYAMKKLTASEDERVRIGNAAKEIRKKLDCEYICDMWENYFRKECI